MTTTTPTPLDLAVEKLASYAADAEERGDAAGAARALRDALDLQRSAPAATPAAPAAAPVRSAREPLPEGSLFHGQAISTDPATGEQYLSHKALQKLDRAAVADLISPEYRGGLYANSLRRMGSSERGAAFTEGSA
jgi:hypothetical protein